jgi:hypothetical protein
VSAPIPSAVSVAEVPRLATLVDTARDLIVGARAVGLEPVALVVAPREFAALEQAKSFEDRKRFPLQLLGIPVLRAAGEEASRLVGLRFD